MVVGEENRGEDVGGKGGRREGKEGEREGKSEVGRNEERGGGQWGAIS